MKICIITHIVAKGDGQGRVNYEVVKEALHQGNEVTLIANKIDEQLIYHPGIRWIEIKSKKIPTSLLKNIVFSAKSSEWLKKHHNEFDIIQTNGAITSSVADINAVHFVHSSWLKSPAHVSQGRRDIYGVYQWFYTKVNSYWEKKSFKSSSSLVAVSDKVRKDLIDSGVPNEKVHVVINGVDLAEFYPGEQDREKIGLPIGVPLAFFAGDIRSSRKNLDTVLKSLVNVPELHLAVAGKTEGSPYPQMSEELGVSNRVHFLGFRRDMADIMRAVDFFVFPSRYEACSLVMLEAMASGLPVITATTAGGAELITNDCGFVLSDPNSMQELTLSLNVLTQQPEMRIQMGRQASTVAKNYSWKLMADQYINIFEKVNSDKTRRIESV
jgi:glycosyltransferase involved in cell wall biosynthesis